MSKVKTAKPNHLWRVRDGPAWWTTTALTAREGFS